VVAGSGDQREMRWKKYAYWLSWFFIFLAMVVAEVMNDILHTRPYWGGVVALAGTGIPSMVIGLDWILTPEDFLNLQKKIPFRRFWFRLSAWEARSVGCVVMLFGALFTTIGILLALESIGISVF
jgi:hypothetical protein